VALALRPGHRGVLIGKTGTGKTTLAQVLSSFHPWVVVHDGKGRINWHGYRVVRKLDQLIRAREPGEHVPARHLIYRPDRYEWDNAWVQERFFKWIYERKRTLVVIDEVYTIVPRPVGSLRGPVPTHFLHCIRQGRELGITVLTGMQRPVGVPVPVLSEAEHAYLFRLRNGDDRERMEKFYGLPKDALGTGLPPHSFYHAYEPIDGVADYTGPIRLSLNK
jgi:hypothetical protein